MPDDERDIYREEILEHYRHPQNFGPIAAPTHTGSANNPLCGDSVVLELNIKGKKVTDVGFTGSGCALSTASASKFTQWLRGQTMKQLKNVKEDQLFRLIEVPITPVRHQCVLLPFTALKKLSELL